jgi:hypothetical protein
VNAEQWIAGFAEKLGMPPPDEAAFDTLLDLAAVAARSSERIAAPIACYLVGCSGISPADALEAAAQVGRDG